VMSQRRAFNPLPFSLSDGDGVPRTFVFRSDRWWRVFSRFAAPFSGWKRFLSFGVIGVANRNRRAKSMAIVHLDDARLLAHFDGELSSQIRQQVADHLRSCWMCRGRFRDLSATVGSYIESRQSQGPDASTDSQRRIRELRQRIAQESEIPTSFQ